MNAVFNQGNSATTARLVEQRDALREALRELLGIVENNWLEGEDWNPDEWECYDKYRDLIAKSKGE